MASHRASDLPAHACGPDLSARQVCMTLTSMETRSVTETRAWTSAAVSMDGVAATSVERLTDHGRNEARGPTAAAMAEEVAGGG
eukprot:1949453-Pleurochrysis_carterae.AAC.1